MRERASSRADRGFSLIELAIAVVAALVVSGAVFGLLGVGQYAFRREPEPVDRHQSARLAMAMITQDVSRAGLNLPPFVQAFADNLNAAGPTAPTGVASDEIEIIGLTDCPAVAVCRSSGTTVATRERLPRCLTLPSLVALWDSLQAGVYWANEPDGAAAISCAGGGGGSNGHVVMAQGQDRFGSPPGGPTFNPEHMAQVLVVRYRVAADADGVSSLWRSAHNGIESSPQSSWQLVARGIEDLQVRYRNATGWQEQPGAVTCGTSCAAPTQADYDRIVRQVRVSISARSAAANLQGQTASLAGGSAVLGQLQQDVTPRAALIALAGSDTGRWF
jgi:prepilin-type N-terminal cleavage/methylation domain-containing protein